MDGRRLANLRDLGCLPFVGSGRTRGGVLYRSDAPYEGDLSPVHVVAWPPAAVIDLRSDREVRRWPYTWPTGTVLVHHPLHEAARPDLLSQAPDLTGLYRSMLDEASDRIAGVLGPVAAAAGPVLVHCAAGKDRTGIVVAALLLAAGVEPAAVIADYQMTERNLAGLRARWQVNGIRSRTGGAVSDGWLEAPEAAISLVVETITGWPGGSRGWWLDHGAAEEDLDTWQQKLWARGSEHLLRPAS